MSEMTADLQKLQQLIAPPFGWSDLLSSSFIALAYCWFHLWAMWAAISKHLPWFARISTLIVVWLPLWAFPDDGHGLRATIVAEVGLSTLVVFACLMLFGALRTPQEREDRFRYNLRDMLLIVGLICSAAAMLAATKPSWVTVRGVLGLPGSLAVNALVVWWAVLGDKPRPRFRWPLAFLLSLLLIVYAVIVENPNEVVKMSSSSGGLASVLNWQAGGWAALCHAVLVLLALQLFRARKKIALSSPNSRMSHVMRVMVCLLWLGMTGVLGVIYYELVKPIRMPSPHIPDPNGIELLVAATQSFTGGDNPQFWTVGGPTTDTLREFITSNREAYELLRAAGRTPSCIRVDYTFPAGPEGYDAIALWRRHADLSIRDGKPGEAMAAFLAMLDVAKCFEAGGVVVHKQTALGAEEEALEGIVKLTREVSREQRQLAIKRIELRCIERESLEQVFARDDLLEALMAGGWSRWKRIFGDKRSKTWIRSSLRQTEELQLAKLRLALVDLAVLEYVDESRKPPKSLDELVPNQLRSVPPGWRNTPMRFQLELDHYSIDAGNNSDSSLVVVRPISR